MGNRKPIEQKEYREYYAGYTIGSHECKVNPT